MVLGAAKMAAKHVESYLDKNSQRVAGDEWYGMCAIRVEDSK
jgi:hypothetical protein